MQVIQRLWEKKLVVSYTVKHKLTIGPINSTPNYLLKRNEGISKHTQLFIGVLFITPINWKTPKDPSTGP